MVQNKYHILSVLVLALCAFMLSACGNNSRYDSKPWVYKPADQLPAEQAPSPLAGKNQPSQNAANESLLNAGQPQENAAYGPQDSSQIQQQAAALAAKRPDLPPVKVALLLPLSGQHSALGQAMLNASQIAMFDVGHDKFQIVPRDTKGTSQGAAQAAQDAINDGAELILGPLFADSVRSAKGVARRYNVNIVAFSTDWTQADNNTFLMGFLPFGQIERAISYAAGQGVRSIGVLAPNTQYGNAATNAYQNAATRAGIQTVTVQKFSENSQNLSKVVQRFSQYNERLQIVNGEEQLAPPPFDAVFVPVGGDTAVTVANLLTQYGLTPQQVRRLGTGLWDDDALRRTHNMRGGWFAAPSPKSRRDFENKYYQLYGASAPRLATLAYDATALAAILAQTGLQSSGRPAFDNASITNPNGFIGIDGVFRFRADGLVERGLAVLEFRGGRTVIVDNAPKTFQTYNSF